MSDRVSPVWVKTSELVRLRGIIQYQREVATRDFKSTMHHNLNIPETISTAKEFVETVRALDTVETAINEAIQCPTFEVKDATS